MDPAKIPATSPTIRPSVALSTVRAACHQALELTVRQAPMLIWLTGPNRNADIEKVLVLGVHGPQELHVVIYRAESKNVAAGNKKPVPAQAGKPEPLKTTWRTPGVAPPREGHDGTGTAS